MLSFTSISSAAISVSESGSNEIVVFCPAFVTTNSMSADLGNLVSAVPFVSTGSISAVPVRVIICPAFVSTGILSVSVQRDIICPAFVSTGILSVSIRKTQIIGEIYRYYFYLTGAADGKDDVIIPMTSFQCRLRSGDPTYLSVSVPYTDDYAEYINDRPNGEMIIKMALIYQGEEMARSEIVRVDLENVSDDEGTKNHTITLTGHKTETFDGNTVTLANAVYRSNKDGAIRLRFPEPHLYLRPGDTVNYESDSFTAELITIFMKAGTGGVITKSMEVAEAA